MLICLNTYVSWYLHIMALVYFLSFKDKTTTVFNVHSPLGNKPKKQTDGY